MMGSTATRFAKLLAWRPGAYLRASGVLFTWLSIRALAQTALFILVARTLGADGYGSLIAVMAVATFFTPLAGLGGQALLLRDGARDPQNLARHLGDALRLWAISVLPLCFLAFLACRLLIPTALPAYAVAAIVLADLAGSSLLELLARAWQALQRMGAFGAVMAGLILARLLTFLAFLTVSPLTPAHWAIWYAAATTCYLVLVLVVAIQHLPSPLVSTKPTRHLALAALPFAFAGTAIRLQAEANKPILARYEGLSGAGTFAAAQRITELLLLPLQALLETLIPRAYKAPDPFEATLRLGVLTLGAAAAAGAALASTAPLLPYFLGPRFEPSLHAVRLLAALPTFFVVRSLLTVALAALDGQRHLPVVYGTAAGTGVLATSCWVPQYGLPGAAAALYASEVASILIQLILLRTKRR